MFQIPDRYHEGTPPSEALAAWDCLGQLCPICLLCMDCNKTQEVNSQTWRAPGSLCPDFFSWRGKSDKGSLSIRLAPLQSSTPCWVFRTKARAGIEGSILKAQFTFPEQFPHNYMTWVFCNSCRVYWYVDLCLCQSMWSADSNPSHLWNLTRAISSCYTHSWQLSKTTTWKALSLSKLKSTYYLLTITQWVSESTSGCFICGVRWSGEGAIVLSFFLPHSPPWCLVSTLHIVGA